MLEQREIVVVDDAGSLERIETHDRIIEQLLRIETSYITDDNIL